MPALTPLYLMKECVPWLCVLENALRFFVAFACAGEDSCQRTGVRRPYNPSCEMQEKLETVVGWKAGGWRLSWASRETKGWDRGGESSVEILCLSFSDSLQCVMVHRQSS